MSVWVDIVSQVENLRSVIEKHAAGSQSGMQRAARLLTAAGRITYAGVGSGLNATIPAYAYLMARANSEPSILMRPSSRTTYSQGSRAAHWS